LPRFKASTPNSVRTTEQRERAQRIEREQRAKSKHVEQLSVITSHSIALRQTNSAQREKITWLSKSIHNLHSVLEKEEQKRIERISKERLKALKADDEEAYWKLVDTAKDTRITHLLRQTDSYLDSLAQAVAVQQAEAGPAQGSGAGFEQEGTSTVLTSL
jgi:ATP-dependent helicase STH1/SNF2